MLSIIIVNYRTWDTVARNLDTLLPSVPAGMAGLLEVVVVDNHSDDGRIGEFQSRYPQVRVLLSDGNYGYAHGCNIGARAAAGEWLLFMNPDVVADWENLHQYWEAARQQPDYQILTAPQYGDSGRLQRSFAPFTTLATYFPAVRAVLRRLFPARYPDPRKPPEQIAGIVDVDWVTGSLVLMSRATFDQLGGWDEDFWLYFEDEDICRRAHDAGMKVGYFPGARFVHSHASSTRSSEEITALTKSETLLSKYLYLTKHEQGLAGQLLRLHMRYSNRLALFFWWLLERVTGGSLRRARRGRRIHERLCAYFRRIARGGSVLSDRSIHFQPGEGRQ